MFAWLKSQFYRETSYPPGPEGYVHYAIGDIHGRLDCLKKAHERIDRDIEGRIERGSAIEVYLGDYVDRGPDSKGVIDCLMARAARAPVVLLRGNHELMMDGFLRGRLPFDDWRAAGGLETMVSYGIDGWSLMQAETVPPDLLVERLPPTHRRFLGVLRHYYAAGPYCFVHAGLRPGIGLSKQAPGDLLWIRDDFLNFSGDFGFIVVHGHTPVSEIAFLPNRINIDTGAFATNRLSVVRIDEHGASALADRPV